MWGSMDKVVVYNVGLYCRLSLDDGNVGESGSIQTQKIILTKYCKDNNLNVYKIYVDDGYSGVNCHRWPAEIDAKIARDEWIMFCNLTYTSEYKIVISIAWLIWLRWTN